MEFIKKKVRIKDHVLFDDQSYAGMTGTTDYKANNDIWWIDLDEESIDLMSYEYKEMCKNKGECYDVICLEENEFEFIN